MPDSILCDNGKPWGDSRGGITTFDVRMMRMGVLPIHGRPLHPQTQGKEERFHRTLKNDLIKRKAFTDIQDAQKAFNIWRNEYNNERPHEALNLDVPSKHYKASKKTLLEYDKPVEYESGKNLRKVNYKGYISIQRRRYYLSESLIDEYIQINPCDDNIVALQYGQFEFAKIDLSEGLIISRRRSRVGSFK